MTVRRIEDILKGALLLEHKAKALYESVLQTSRIEGIRNIFAMLVKEEEKHVKLLTEQLVRKNRGESFDLSAFKENFQVVEHVVDDHLVEQISGAGYEAAVISAALDFEKRAVEFYSEQEREAEEKEEKELFNWLVKWEKTHLYMMAKLDEEIKERIWFDNQFWPLD